MVRGQAPKVTMEAKIFLRSTHKNGLWSEYSMQQTTQYKGSDQLSRGESDSEQGCHVFI